jgi:hypothetical protein
MIFRASAGDSLQGYGVKTEIPINDLTVQLSNAAEP